MAPLQPMVLLHPHERKDYVGRVEFELRKLQEMSAEEFQRMRGSKLHALVEFHYANNPRYRGLMQEHGVEPRHIKAIDDIVRLPLVTKEHILEDAPWGFVSVPREHVATFLETSGSTGKAKHIAVSKGEKRRIFELSARCFYLGGFRDDAPTMAIFPRGRWPSAFFVQDGCENLGPTLRGEMRDPIDWFLERFEMYRPGYLVTSPSFIGKLVQDSMAMIRDGHYDSDFVRELKRQGSLDGYFRHIGFRSIVVGGEKMGQKYRQQLEDIFGCPVWDGYGCAETGITAIECPTRKGLHYFGDDIVMEAIDPETLQPKPFGEDGEMVITHLYKDSMPIIRYRMKDVIALHSVDNACECGAPLPRMSHIRGRTDDMIKVGGGNIYPEIVWDAVAQFPELNKAVFQFEVDRHGMKDQIYIRVQLNDGCHPRSNLDDQLVDYLRSNIGELDYVIRAGMVEQPIVQIRQPGELYQGQGKLQRFIDRKYERNDGGK